MGDPQASAVAELTGYRLVLVQISISIGWIIMLEAVTSFGGGLSWQLADALGGEAPERQDAPRRDRSRPAAAKRGKKPEGSVPA